MTDSKSAKRSKSAIDVGAALAATAPSLPPASRPNLPTALTGIPNPSQSPVMPPSQSAAAGAGAEPRTLAQQQEQSHPKAPAGKPPVPQHQQGVVPVPNFGDLSQLVDKAQTKPLRRSVEVPVEYEQLLSARLHPIIARLGTKSRRATKDILTAEIVALSMIIVERALPTLSDAELEACLGEAQKRKSERLIQRRSISLFKSLSQRLGVGAQVPDSSGEE